MSARGILFLLTVAAASLLGTLSYQRANENPWVRKARIESGETMASLASTPNRVAGWPPRIGEQFPAVELLDHEGKQVSIESWRGKPTLVEIVAMTCAGCQAFSGGSTHGGFGGLAVQGGLDSIERYVRDYGGVELFGGDINFAQIIIYNLRLEPARPLDVKHWREHFGFDRHPEAQILAGGEPLANEASFRMIPGFLLLDRDLKVLFDATGHTPKHSLYRELLPALRTALEKR